MTQLKMVFGSPTTVISVPASLTNGSIAGGTAELDNSITLAPFAVATLSVPDAFGGVPNDMSSVDLYMVRKNVDGTDDDTALPSGTDPDSAEYVGSFLIYNENIAQRKTITINLAGVKYADFYIKNSTGQTLTLTTTPVTVKITPFSYQDV